MSENGVIGRGNALPWHLPADLKRFKQLTTGHTIIMGRKTFESIGKPLPGRRSIVITRNMKWKAPSGVEVAHDLDGALQTARSGGNQEIFIIGGAEIFRQALPLADRIYLTLVLAMMAGDAKFPEINPSHWELLETTNREADGDNAYAMSFQVYERVHTALTATSR